MIPSLDSVTAVTGASSHSLACKAYGRVFSWGDNSFGQLGDGTNFHRRKPVETKNLVTIVEISATSYAHSVALKSDGTVWTWGRNHFGQLGDGTYFDRTTPGQVPGLSSVKSIASGWGHVVALKTDGTVWTWGWNYSGQLGDGTTSNRNRPVQVPSLGNVVSIASGYRHTIALKADGTVWAWGNNYYGQLGDGTTTDHATPVRVINLDDVVRIAAGAEYSVAVKSDGTVWSWGANYDGQLGDGTTENRHSPVQVLGVGGNGFLDLNGSSPNVPANPSPSDGEIDVPISDIQDGGTITLGWIGGDPDTDDTVTYFILVRLLPG